MIQKAELEKKVWWGYLEEDLRGLLLQAFHLAEKVPHWEVKFHDYSFVVFPAAKAYEGFLKKLFLDMSFISSKQYYGKRLRVGKALNPQLKTRFKNESVYNKLVSFCGDANLPDRLWQTWKQSRNLLFHWFPKEANAVEFNEALDRLGMIVDSIDSVYTECKIKVR